MFESGLISIDLQHKTYIMNNSHIKWCRKNLFVYNMSSDSSPSTLVMSKIVLRTDLNSDTVH